MVRHCFGFFHAELVLCFHVFVLFPLLVYSSPFSLSFIFVFVRFLSSLWYPAFCIPVTRVSSGWILDFVVTPMPTFILFAFFPVLIFYLVWFSLLSSILLLQLIFSLLIPLMCFCFIYITFLQHFNYLILFVFVFFLVVCWSSRYMPLYTIARLSFFSLLHKI